jgi:hypothetical protein
MSLPGASSTTARLVRTSASLDLTDQAGPALPDHDFWLFDDITVVKLLYRPDGTQIGRELLDKPDLDAYLAWRDATWQAAIPFRDYWAGLTTGV